VIDTNKEAIAVAEAKTLNIPVVAVLDSNSDPVGISYPVPGNDDASRAINLYCDLMVGAVLDGLQAEMAASGTDMGAFETPPEEVDSAAPEEIESTPPEEVAAAEQAPAAAAPETETEAEAETPERAEPAVEQPMTEPARPQRRQDERRGTAAAG
jgi:small subunit ribosomal protein S2